MSKPKSKPTKRQIAEEVEALKELKSKVPSRTAFGDDNEAAIDAQIEVLESDLEDDDIYNRADGDMTAEEDLWTDHVKDSALTARRWMDGDESTSPSDDWAPLVAKS